MSLYKNRRDKYIDLKINGRIFPQWILANFKSYKLPDIMQTEDDPCFTKTKDELRKYQVFLSKYLAFLKSNKASEFLFRYKKHFPLFAKAKA